MTSTNEEPRRKASACQVKYSLDVHELLSEFGHEPWTKAQWVALIRPGSSRAASERYFERWKRWCRDWGLALPFDSEAGAYVLPEGAAKWADGRLAAWRRVQALKPERRQMFRWLAKARDRRERLERQVRLAGAS